jgi:hypothetical protein
VGASVPLVAGPRGEVDVDEMCRRAGCSLGKQRRADRVGALAGRGDFGDRVCEQDDVARRLGDLEWNVGGPPEHRAEQKVARLGAVGGLLERTDRRLERIGVLGGQCREPGCQGVGLRGCAEVRRRTGDVRDQRRRERGRRRRGRSRRRRLGRRRQRLDERGEPEPVSEAARGGGRGN